MGPTKYRECMFDSTGHYPAQMIAAWDEYNMSLPSSPYLQRPTTYSSAVQLYMVFFMEPRGVPLDSFQVQGQWVALDTAG